MDIRAFIASLDVSLPNALFALALAVASMNKIIEMADMVIPGHERPFSVGEEMQNRVQ